MRTLLDPYEVNPQLALLGARLDTIASGSGSVDIEVSWDDEPTASRFPCTQGVTAEAWSRSRGWSADD
jgi:hypothetical protein